MMRHPSTFRIAAMQSLAHASPLWLYFLLVAGIIALPGMDMAFVLASALAGGRRSGLAAVGGMVTGGWCHMLFGALGIGLLLQAAPGLVDALLLAGAAYVAWIGWTLIAGGAAPLAQADGPRRPALATWGRAMATCLLNPKAYLFTLAVFPQFLRADGPPLAAQAGALAAITSATQVAIYGGLVLAASHARGWLRDSPAAQRRAGQGVGWLLVLAAAWTALHGLAGAR